MKMREIINIVEAVGKNVPTAFYHGSKKRLKNGVILTARSSGYVRGTRLDSIEREAHDRCEAVLEKYRPGGAIPRSEAIFMVDAPDADTIEKAGGYGNYIYLVQPVGEVWRCNLHWYSELFSYCYDDIDEGMADDFAHKYWSAAPSEHSLFEYLARSATIIKTIQ